MRPKIKKSKLIISIFLFAFFALFVFVLPSFAPQNLGGFAQDLEVEYPTVPGAPLPAKPTLPEYIKYVYNLAIISAGLIAFFSLIYGGFRYLISVGRPTAMADARAQITAGIVGLIILLGSYLFLITVNPELTILRIGPLELALRCTSDADCYGDQVCKNGVCVVSVKPLLLTARTYYLHEIPIGQLIERVLEPNRLGRLNAAAKFIKDHSAKISNKTQEFLDGIQKCSCNNTKPNPDECEKGTYYWCFSSAELCEANKPPGKTCNSRQKEVLPGGFIVWEWCWGEETKSCPPLIVCEGDPCKDPNKAELMAMKQEIKNLSDQLAAKMEEILPDLTSFKKDTKILELGIAMMKATMYPINYDNMLEMKQVILEIGGDVKIVPFTILGQTIRGKGDPATFYTDEDRIKELMASGDWPDFPTLDTLATCDECEINLHVDIDMPNSIKEGLAATYPTIKNKTCPGGIDCWDYIVNWSKANNWNPAFILTMWGEESGFDDDGTPCDIGGKLCWTLGVVDCAAGRGVAAQLQCFTDIVNNCSGFCQAGNTDFCAFMRCYSGGASCTLSNNPNFWPNFFDLYTRLIPGEADPGSNPAYPSGNCTPSAPGGPLPPELAGCPLQPGFGFTCGWGGYPGHEGMDFPVPNGTPIYAIADGTIHALDLGTCGTTIHLETEYGTFRYCHLMETVIPLGASMGVLKGALIGLADATGGSYAPHLHFGYFPNGPFGEAYPAECLHIDCLDAAPDNTAGVCGPDRRDDPTLCW